MVVAGVAVLRSRGLGVQGSVNKLGMSKGFQELDGTNAVPTPQTFSWLKALTLQSTVSGLGSGSHYNRMDGRLPCKLDSRDKYTRVSSGS